MGGVLGGRLAEAGRDVTFLVRARRAQQIAERGLQIVGGSHETTIRPALARAGAIEGPYDLVIVGVKSYSLASAVDDLAPAVGPATSILPILNGLRHLDVLRARFGEAVLGGSCYVSANLDAEGRVHQLLDVQRLVFGEIAGGATARVRDVERTMQGVGFEVTPTENILQEMWKKWVFIAVGSAVTCLFRGLVGEIVAVPGGADLSKAVLDEGVAVAEACGFGLPADFVQQCADGLAQPGSTFAASMYHDMMAGSPVEVDQILGDMLARAGEHGLRTPLLRAAYTALRVYSAKIDR